MSETDFLYRPSGGIQQGLTAFSNALVQAYVNGLGSSVIMAGWSCHAKIDQFAILPAQSMGQAATTFVGQNLGAGNVKRARDGVKQTNRIGVGVLIAISALMGVSASWLVSLFSRPGRAVLRDAVCVDRGAVPLLQRVEPDLCRRAARRR